MHNLSSYSNTPQVRPFISSFAAEADTLPIRRHYLVSLIKLTGIKKVLQILCLHKPFDN